MDDNRNEGFFFKWVIIKINFEIQQGRIIYTT